MPKGSPLPAQEVQRIVEIYNECRKRGMGICDSYKRAAEITGQNWRHVGQIVTRLQPTTNLAKMYLRAKSYRLVKRLVQKANTTEILDIISRPDMAILAPSKTLGNESSGFFISVNAQDCGAVKVGVMQAAPEPKQLEEGDVVGQPYDPLQDYIDVQREMNDEDSRDAQTANQHTAQISHAESAVHRARQKLADARRGLTVQSHPEKSSGV